MVDRPKISQSAREPKCRTSGDLIPEIPQDVLFIGGQGRSGSTLLARLLAAGPSVVSVGELMYIAERGFYGHELCSCGDTFDQCEFWARVMTEVTDEDLDAWFARFRALQRRVSRRRSLPRILFAVVFPTRTRVESALYSEMLGELMTSVGKVSGAQVVVDSSKEPIHGLHLRRSKSVRLNTVHLVRDCRAVTFSLQRVRVRSEVQAGTAYMANLSTGRSAFLWVLLNLMAEALGGEDGGSYRLARYECLASQPQAVVDRLTPETVSAMREASGGASEGAPPVEHEVSGNPMRFEPVRSIEPDIQWVRGLSRWDFFVSTLIGWPLLVRYGYPLRRTRP